MKAKKKKIRLPTTAEYPVLKEGMLSKVGGMHRMWRQRYCVVRGGFLEYYVDRQAWNERKEPKGTIPLFFAKLESLTENIAGRQFAFSIKLAEEPRVYMFVCANLQEEDSWCEVLCAEISRLQEEDNNTSNSTNNHHHMNGFSYLPASEKGVIAGALGDRGGERGGEKGDRGGDRGGEENIPNLEIVPLSASSSAPSSASSSVDEGGDFDTRFTGWLSNHIQNRKDAATLIRNLAKHLTKISGENGTGGEKKCACMCMCCGASNSNSNSSSSSNNGSSGSSSTSNNNNVGGINKHQQQQEEYNNNVLLLDDILRLIDPKTYLKNNTDQRQGGGSNMSGRGALTHSASSVDVLTEEGWLAKKKKVLLEGKFSDLIKMVTRGNASNTNTQIEERERGGNNHNSNNNNTKGRRVGKIEYHEIVPQQLKIGNMLGSGATGIVYAGTYFEQVVAVKKLHPHIAAELSAIEEFIQEAEIWKPLTFRNILQLYGVCADPGNVCMVMEIGAQSLSDLLYKEKQTPDLPWVRRLNIARDIASGCLYLHSKNIVHRDLKSMNILLSHEGIVKICDFGMSKTLGEIEEETEAMQGVLNADQVMGTPQWLAPEVADGEPYTKAADVYSFGIVLWEIGSRRLPFSTTPKLEDAQPNALLAEVAKGIRPLTQSIQPSTVPHVEERYVALMNKCWGAQAERPHFEYILNELSEILDLEEGRNRNKEREALMNLQRGNEHFNKREYDLAIGCLKRSLQCVPDISGYMCYWLCCMSLKHVDDALSVCVQWSKDFPYCTPAWVKKGDTLMYQHKFPDALAAYKEGQSLDPYDIAVKNKMKDCQKNMNIEIDLDSSIVVAKKLVHRETLFKRNPPPRPPRLDGTAVPPRLGVGRAYMDVGRAFMDGTSQDRSPRFPPRLIGRPDENAPLRLTPTPRLPGFHSGAASGTVPKEERVSAIRVPPPLPTQLTPPVPTPVVSLAPASTPAFPVRPITPTPPLTGTTASAPALRPNVHELQAALKNLPARAGPSITSSVTTPVVAPSTAPANASTIRTGPPATPSVITPAPSTAPAVAAANASTIRREVKATGYVR